MYPIFRIEDRDKDTIPIGARTSQPPAPRTPYPGDASGRAQAAA
jgi:hypothetical protein